MKIKSIAPVILIVVIIVVAVLAGWIALGPLLKPSGPSITVIQDTPVDRVPLSSAIAALNSSDQGRMMFSPNYTIHSVFGEDMDSSGNAKTWIIAVKNGTSQFYFEYSDNLFKEYDWRETNIDQPILLDKFIAPAELFTLHRSMIEDIFGQPPVSKIDLQLGNGEYILISYSNGPTQYVFNAYSGEIVTG